MDGIYCDGGVLKVNPSPFGGSWAWCLVEAGAIVRSASGIILPSECDGGPVSNNVSELRAAVEALESTPRKWGGTLYSDSQVTLGRLFKGWPLNGVPEELACRVKQFRQDLRDYPLIDPVLLQGHPTKADLACGIGHKRGLPVSRWNCWCDERCQQEAAKYLASLKVGV